MPQPRRRFSMLQLDVFADRPLEGNPLAVFTDGRGLSDGEMQALAREMNLSETTFVLPRDAATERERGVRVRIFTVAEELPFAGHPTLGTAFALHVARGGPAEVVLELNVGRVPVRFEDRAGAPAFGEMTQIDPTFGQQHDRGAAAAALGLRPEDLDPGLPVQTVSTGMPFVIAPLRSLDVLEKLRPDLGKTQGYLAGTDGKFFYCVTRDSRDPAVRLRSRMFFYGGEDPATGSASGCAAAWMVAHGVAQPDEPARVLQGVEMRRPSHIHVRAGRQGSRIVNVRVGGQTVEVMRGEVYF
jgi:trans-2,3-dihydro-3-hydroxyanthranilate isomerase